MSSSTVSNAKAFASFAVVQFIAFLVLVTNLRAVSTLQYWQAAVTEMLYLGIQWTVLKRIASSESRWAQAGYMVGGAAGTLASMWLTRAWQ